MARSAPRGRGRRALLLGAALCIACGGSRRLVTPAEMPAPAVTELRPTSLAAPSSELVLVTGGVLAPGGAEAGSVASFELGRTEVTVAEYRKCVEAGACQEPGPYSPDLQPSSPECREKVELECNFQRSDGGDHPINCVTVKHADSYCAWRGQRLPTSAEWELAARGTEGRAYPWGDEDWEPERANLCDLACSETFPCPFAPASTQLIDGFASTSPVGSFPAGNSPSGIVDLLGNVEEYTSTSAQGDGAGTAGTTGHIARGSSWASDADLSFRSQLTERHASPSVGFRCARDVRNGKK